ncbi:hypothetical protein SESBI_14334 [Sesbania bispinosa]|nr:hypothetical protein SESBI_14334 [Sesbania bispinosa]
MANFSHCVMEGQIYRIPNFAILRNLGKFKACVHEFKVIFNATTKIIPCQNVSIPLFDFALVKSNDIKKTNGRSQYLIGSAL